MSLLKPPASLHSFVVSYSYIIRGLTAYARSLFQLLQRVFQAMGSTYEALYHIVADMGTHSPEFVVSVSSFFGISIST